MIINTPAIVLKSFPYGDTSLIARCFSKDNGKISLIIKGARSKKSSKGKSGSSSKGGTSKGGSKAKSSGSRGQGGGKASRTKGGSFGGKRRRSNTK